MNKHIITGAAALAAAAAVGLAPAAHATEEQYLHNLSGEQFYQRLGPQTLLAEGYRVCDAHVARADNATIRQLIINDLAVSQSAAIDIKVAAEMYLGC